jgi:hypothetical protein
MTWQTTGSVCDKVKQYKRTVLTEENVQDVQGWLQITWLAQETGISLGPAFTATGLIKCHPYKITVLHELKPPDSAAKNSPL